MSHDLVADWLLRGQSRNQRHHSIQRQRKSWTEIQMILILFQLAVLGKFVSILLSLFHRIMLVVESWYRVTYYSIITILDFFLNLVFHSFTNRSQSQSICPDVDSYSFSFQYWHIEWFLTLLLLWLNLALLSLAWTKPNLSWPSLL